MTHPWQSRSHARRSLPQHAADAVGLWRVFGRMSSLGFVVRILVLASVLVAAGSLSAYGQTYSEWTGGGTNWADTSNWASGVYGYGQLEFKGNGNTTSWNNKANPESQWRFYFSGSKAYTLGGDAVSLFDYGGQKGGILSDSTANQTINMQLNFVDTGSRDMFILTRNSGGLTFSNISVGGNVTALGFGGTNTNSIITVKGTLSGSKPIVIGTNAFDGGTSGMGTTRVVFSGSNTYTGTTTVLNGILTAAHNNALGSSSAGTEVKSGASLHLSNGITISSEPLTIAGSGVDGLGALRSMSGSNKFLGAITNASGGKVTIGAATNATLVISNIGLSGGSEELWVAGDGTTIIAGNATDAGGTALVKTNTGTLVLMGNNSWSGDEYIREGTVIISNNNALGNGGTTVIGSSSSNSLATLQFGSGITNSNAIKIEAPSGSDTGKRTISYQEGSGQAAQLNDITIDGGSKTGVNHFGVEMNIKTGGTMLLGGNVKVDNPADTNRFVVDGGGKLIVTNTGGSSGADNYQVRIANGEVIIGSGNLISRTNKSGFGHAIDLGLDFSNNQVAGPSILRGSNGVTISNSIYVGAGGDRILGASGSGATVTFSGSQIDLTGTAITLEASNGQTVNIGSLIQNNGAASTNNQVIKTGAGVVTLSNTTNSYSGATIISNGTLKAVSIANAGTASSVGVHTNIVLAGSTSSGATFEYLGGNVTHNRTLVATNGGGTVKLASSNTVMTLTGKAEGAGTLELNTGTFVLSNTTTANSFAPDTIKIDSGTTLQLGAANQIGNSTKIDMNGGTFLTGTSSVGNSDTMGTMTLSANSTLDFGGPNNRHDLNFADSSAISWNAGQILTITNWYRDVTTAPDDRGLYGRLYFGSNASALTSHQLEQIKFNIGGTLYDARILADGEVVPDMPPIPEPRVYGALALLLAAIGWRERKRILSFLRHQIEPKAPAKS